MELAFCFPKGIPSFVLGVLLFCFVNSAAKFSVTWCSYWSYYFLEIPFSYLFSLFYLDYIWSPWFMEQLDMLCDMPFVVVFVHTSGMAVAYSAPARHGCLKVVENNYCASKRGMCSFWIILALFLAKIWMLVIFVLWQTFGIVPYSILHQIFGLMPLVLWRYLMCSIIFFHGNKISVILITRE